jgi:hypothetical protein
MENNKRYRVAVQEVENHFGKRIEKRLYQILYDNLRSETLNIPKNWEPNEYCRYLNGVEDDRNIYIREIIAYAG